MSQVQILSPRLRDNVIYIQYEPFPAQTMLKHCLSFAVIENSTQRLVGFARVLTDEVRYAYIYDVMTEETLRGKGVVKMIMQAILSHPKLTRIKYFELTCMPNIIEYYRRFRFTDNYGKVTALRLTTLA